MAKMKKKRKNTVKKADNLPKTELNEEALTRIITNALIAYDKHKEREAEEKLEQKEDHYIEVVGYKDYSDEKQPKRAIKTFFNNIKVIFRSLFIRTRDIKDVRITLSLIKLFSYLFFAFISLCLHVACLLLIVYIPLQYTITNITPLPWYETIMLAFFALTIFLLARVFRIAKIEVDNLSDSNLIFGFFTAIVSIISIVIAIIAIVK